MSAKVRVQVYNCKEDSQGLTHQTRPPITDLTTKLVKDIQLSSLTMEYTPLTLYQRNHSKPAFIDMFHSIELTSFVFSSRVSGYMERSVERFEECVSKSEDF